MLCSPLRFAFKIHFFLYDCLSYNEKKFNVNEENSYDLQCTFSVTLVA